MINPANYPTKEQFVAACMDGFFHYLLYTYGITRPVTVRREKRVRKHVRRPRRK